ncbi:MAG: oligosaccharide flippase family protein [Bacteroidetes bacterium]|nr:oligosaccharide flippase family protein [Bacteroidota bacterium]MCW5896096.1 oligosaccharide flippase family protein [Bacteroidota bacterium]
MSKAKQTFHSAIWNHGGRILEYLLMYITSIVIARGLGVEENGRFVGLFSLSHLILVFCSLGLETSLNKFIPQLADEHANKQAAYMLRMSLLIRGAAFLAAVVLFSIVIRMFTVPFLERNSDVLVIVLLFTGARSLFPLFAMVLTAQLRTALTARINLVIRVIELAGILILTQMQFTVFALFILFFSTSIMHGVAYAMFSRVNIVRDVASVDMKPIVTFGGIYWMNTIVDFVLGRQGDVLFLTSLLPDTSQGGLYDVAYSIAQIASIAMTVGLSGVTFATFARLAVEDQSSMNRFYAFSIRIISLLTIPLYTFIIFHAEAIVAILYSPQYASSAPLVQGILVFRIASRLFGGPENGEYLLSRGRVATLVSIGVVAALVNFGLNILLIPTLGASGSVIASGCGNLLVNLLGALMVSRISQNRLQIVYWAGLVSVCCIPALICAYVLPSDSISSLIFAASLYGALLIGGLVLLKPLTQTDKDWLAKIDGRMATILRLFTRPSLQSP